MPKIQDADVKSESELITLGATKVQLINDTKIYVSANSINKSLDQAIIDGDIGGGGSSSGSDLEHILDLAERGELFPPQHNSLLDRFNELQPDTVKVDMVESNSDLQIDSVETSGTYEMTETTGPKMATMQGVAPFAVRFAEANSRSGANGETWVLRGDVRDYFPDTKRVLIARVQTQNTKTTYQHIYNDSNVVARLAVSGTPTYNVGNDETTIVIANPESKDLEFGLSGQPLLDEVRISPFEWIFKASANGTGNYETLNIDELHGLEDITFTAANFLNLSSFATTPTALIIASDVSDNSQYMIVKILEDDNSDKVYRFYTSSNSGATWREEGTKLRNSTNVGGDHAEGVQNVAIANNGKWVSIYYTLESGSANVKAVYGDASSGSVDFNDIADAGDGAGYVVDTAQQEISSGGIAMDRVDASYIGIVYYSTANNGSCRLWTNGGGTFDTTESLGGIGHLTSPKNAIMIGTGTSHTLFSATRTVAGLLQWIKVIQGTPGVTSGTIKSNSFLVDSVMSKDEDYILYLAVDDGGDFLVFLAQRVSDNVIVTDIQLHEETTVFFDGDDEETNSNIHMQDRVKQRILPSKQDNLRCFMTYSADDVGTLNRPIFWEIEDFLTVNEFVQSQLTINSTDDLFTAASNERIGQTFTGLSDTVRCFIFRWGRTGLMGDADTITINLRVGSTMGAGALIQSVVISDLNKITQESEGQEVHLNLDNSQTLTGDYNLEFIPSYSIDAINYIGIKMHSAAGYGGARQNYNGSVWSAQSGDLMFEIRDFWKDVFNKKSISPDFSTLWNQGTETCMSFKDDTTISYLYRVMVGNELSGSQTKDTGIAWTLDIDVSNTSAKSVVGVEKLAFYDPAKHNEHLIYNVACAADECKGRDSFTGIIDTTTSNARGDGIYDRSLGIFNYNAAANATKTVDLNFFKEVCLNFNGTTHYYAYTALKAQNLQVNQKFCMMAEIHPGDPAGDDRMIISKHASAQASWYLSIDTSGYLNVNTATNPTTSVFTTADDKLEPQTYHWVAATGDGTTVKLWRHEGSSWIEIASYSAQVVAGYGGSDATAPPRLGSNGFGDYWKGKLGIVKVQFGDDTIPSMDFYDQSPIVQLHTKKGRFFGMQMHGNLGGSNTTGLYDVAGYAEGGGAWVESHAQLARFEHDLTAPAQGNSLAFKVEASRGTLLLIEKLFGFLVKFVKSS